MFCPRKNMPPKKNKPHHHTVQRVTECHKQSRRMILTQGQSMTYVLCTSSQCGEYMSQAIWKSLQGLKDKCVYKTTAMWLLCPCCDNDLEPRSKICALHIDSLGWTLLPSYLKIPTGAEVLQSGHKFMTNRQTVIQHKNQDGGETKLVSWKNQFHRIPDPCLFKQENLSLTDANTKMVDKHKSMKHRGTFNLSYNTHCHLFL